MAVAATLHLRMTDMTDREVLGLVADQADEDGWAESTAIASALWPRVFSGSNTETQQSAVRAVAIRLAWMRRYGVVEKDRGSGRARWALTKEGAHLLDGRLSTEQGRALKSLKGAPLVLAVHAITERPADTLVETLMRRAWRYGTAGR